MTEFCVRNIISPVQISFYFVRFSKNSILPLEWVSPDTSAFRKGNVHDT
jgi:hypothetical protein